MKNAASIAFNMKRKAQEEAKSPEDHAASIAHAILSSRKGMADGGMVEPSCMDLGGSVEEMSESGDDFLSSDADTDLEPVEDRGLVEDEDRKKRLGSILASVRYGK